jgi:hypothetical protein
MNCMPVARVVAVGLLLAGCGSTGEPGEGPRDGGTSSPDGSGETSRARDSGASGDTQLDATMTDAPKDSRGSGERDDSSSDAGPDGLPLAFFSMTTHSLGTADLPTVPFGGLRLWDTSATWPTLNTAAGVYDWTSLDAWLAEAQSAGVDVLFTFGRTPTWASLRPTEICTYGVGCAAPPADVASGDTTLKSFTTALVNHSLASKTAHIKYYEIWNEPDLTGTWSGTPAQLVTMGQDIAAIVHALDKDALVIGPSPSTANEYGVHFLPSYYDAGGAPNTDIVGIHAYLYTGSTFSTVPEGIVVSITELQTLMAAYGLAGKPIVFTEGSWGSSPTDTSLSDDEKIAYLARDYLLMWMNGVERFYWYAWDNSEWGTLYGGGSVQPAGTAYGILAGWLTGSMHAATDYCTQDSASTWVCSIIMKSGQAARILWNPMSTVSVPALSTEAVYLTLDDTKTNPITFGTVSVGAKPILTR